MDNALAVMKLESGNNPGAHNFNPATGDDSWGLLQVNRYGSLAAARPSAEWLTVPANNIAYAAGIWRAQGWCRPWPNTAREAGICK